METLDLAGRGRRTGLGQAVRDPVLPADPIEQHLNRRLVEPAGEHLAVVGQDLAGDTPPAHRQRQPVTHLARRLTRHQPRRHTEPGVIIDPGERLGLRAVRQHEPADHVHLPQLHRRATFPPLPLTVPRPTRVGIDQVQPHQRPIHPRLRRHRLHTTLGELEHQPPRTPRRMRPAQLRQRHLDLGRHLMRTRPRPMRPITQVVEPAGFVLRQPRMQRLTRHPQPGRHLRHRAPLGDHRQHRLIPLLAHTHLPHGNECQESAETAVKHQPTTVSTISRRPKVEHQPK